MQVTIKPPTPLEASDVKAGEEGIALRPLFYNPKGQGTIGLVEVKKEDGTVVFKGVLSVSGKTGEVSIQTRTTPVAAALDASAKKGTPK